MTFRYNYFIGLMQGVGCSLWDNDKEPSMEDIMEYISLFWLNFDKNTQKRIANCLSIISDDEIII